MQPLHPKTLGITLLCMLLHLRCVAQPVQSQPENEGRMVSVGSYRLFLRCSGKASSPTVILLSGLGLTSTVWDKAQPNIAKLFRVCSYDREGMGKSDIHIPLHQSAVQIIDDLHALLANAGISPPFVLVGHSMGGIYARRFAATHPTDVSGLVFVDSAHEEQVWRYEAISHALLFEYQDWPNYSKLGADGWLPPGARLNWHQDVPLVVLEHGIMVPRGLIKGLDEQAYEETKAAWHSFQLDLASRSKCSSFDIATQSGHFIQIDQPDIIAKAIQTVVTMPCSH